MKICCRKGWMIAWSSLILGLAGCCGLPAYPQPDALAGLGAEPKSYWIPGHWEWRHHAWRWVAENWKPRPRVNLQTRALPGSGPDALSEGYATTPWWSIFLP